MRLPSLAAAALLAALLPVPPAAASVWQDEELGLSVDLGTGWDVTTSPREVPGERLGRAAARFRRGDAEGWVFVYGNAPADPAKEATAAARLAAHVLSSRYEAAKETLVPGLSRPADFGAATGMLLEFEVTAAGGKGVTRVGRTALVAHGGRLHLLLVERPAAGAAAADLAEIERLALSLRVGSAPGAAAKGAFPPVPSVPSPVRGDALPSAEFRSAVEMRRVATLPSGIQLFRQYYLFEGARLPSYLAHLLGKEYETEGRKEKTPDLLLLLVNNVKGKEDVSLRVEVQLLEFSEPASRTVTVPAGETAAVSLSPTFSAALYGLAEQRPGGVRLRVTSPEGAVLHEETERIVLLGRNDFFWRDGTGRSWSAALAAFVTPHDAGRKADGLLRQAKDHCSLGAMVGYQEVKGADRAKVVGAQVQAVYEALATAGHAYVNAPFSTDAAAQRIKYPTETLEDRSGNCIETVLVFASAFEAMGMQPVLLIYEDHAQVAVRAWADDPTLLVLETTLCGRAPFAEASARGKSRYQEALAAKKPPEVVDVHEWRTRGISPVPR